MFNTQSELDYSSDSIRAEKSLIKKKIAILNRDNAYLLTVFTLAILSIPFMHQNYVL